MQDKILSVFYGEDRLPYKDASRETHYPIVNGNVFNGANNVTKIRYYLDRIGGFANVTWVVVSKLPNGQLASEVLNSNNAVLDSELGENYIEFEISSYYTTLKGDVYLSVQGYQGGVEVEQDEDTGIYSIYGTPTIQATGSIKIGVNYAPQTVQGTHFTTSDLQQVLGALSDKANISDVFVVLDDISTSDLSGYDDGQLFYDKATQCFYIWNYASETYSRYDRLLYYCPSSYLQLSLINDRYGDLWVSYIDSGDLVLAKVTTGYSVNAYRFGANGTINCYIASGQSGTTTLHTIISGTPTYSYAKQSDLVYKRGSYQVVDFTTTTIETLYNNVDTSETFRIGGSNLIFRGTYLLEKGSNLGSNYYFKITCIEHDSVEMIGMYWQPTLGGVAPTTTLQTIFINLTNIPATKDYVDDKIADFMQKEYQNVNTTTYPTLDDFLASTGTEGYIYLYPTGVNNDYYQYIWENSGWVSLGTTQLELSDYYTKDEADNKFVAKTTTIADIDLQDNIGSQELTDALVFASNSDIDNLFA